MKNNFLQHLWLVFGFSTALIGSANLANGQTTNPPAGSQSPQQEPATKPGQDAAGAKQGDSTATDVPAAEPFVIKVADENLQFTVTGAWENVPPKSGMLEAEIKIPKVGDDALDGRLTIMGAGGTVEANVIRWQDQFTQPEGGKTEAKTEQKTVADQTVHLVDISGTYLDSPGGPFAGQEKIERKNYRMLAAIIETEARGNYFVKFYGPKATVDKNAEAFQAMIESLKVAQ